MNQRMARGMLAVVAVTMVLVCGVVVIIARWDAPPGGGVATIPVAGPRSFSPTPAGLLGSWDPLTPSPTPAIVDGYPVSVPGVPASPSPLATASSGQGAFVGVSGAGCSDTASAGSFAAYPAGTAAVLLAGGWTGDRCKGWFWSVPMSERGDEDNERVYVMWWFKTGQPDKGDCAVWVFVPKGPRDADVAGEPTHYQVLRGRSDKTILGTFTVDQTTTRATWVLGGTFAYPGSEIAIKMVNRGTKKADVGHHGAAQATVRCVPR